MTQEDEAIINSIGGQFFLVHGHKTYLQFKII